MNQFNLETETTRDLDGNLSSIYAYTYDESDNLVNQSLDFEGDGEFDFISDYSYDAEGDLILENRDSDGDGVMDEVITYTHIDNGDRFQERADYGDNGSIDEIFTYTYDYNSGQFQIDFDYNADGNAEEIIFSVYDKNGRFIQEAYDYDGDGTVDELYAYVHVYDESGKPTQRFNYYSSETQATLALNYTYEDNNLATIGFDYENDGISDLKISYTYDEDNNLASEGYDYENDGVNDFTAFYISIYDDNDNLIEQQLDYYNDGIADLTYLYDGNGNLIEQRLDSYSDGTADEITYYHYDSQDKIVSAMLRSDSNQDGVIDTTLETITYQYDEYGIVQADYDEYGDGSLDGIFTYIYDDDGNLEQNLFFDGFSLDSTTTYSYREYEYVESDLKPQVVEMGGSQLLLTEVHRFYEYNQGYHLYTSDANEINIIQKQSNSGALSYNYETSQYQVLADSQDRLTGEDMEGVEAVYRFFNTHTGAHLYTMDENEKEVIQANLPHYNFEGVAYYAFEVEPENLETVPVYRMLNNSSGAHLFSINSEEIESIQDNLPHFSMENNGNAAFYVFEL